MELEIVVMNRDWYALWAVPGMAVITALCSGMLLRLVTSTLSGTRG
jgi:uncharacterized membrane protein